MLRLRNIYKSFNHNQVLRGISLEVGKNSILGLAGSSGSGKSTLLRCIQKLETIDAGEILCDEPTGFMFQDFQLFPHMTVLQNIVYAMALKDKTKTHEAEALKILSSLNIYDKAYVYPASLSGGQKQRTALARSLMLQPKILLCDEPTSGLDIATTLDVVTLLTSVKNLGVTMVIASHDLDFLTKVADRIIVLKNGQIALDVNLKNLPDPIYFLKDYY